MKNGIIAITGGIGSGKTVVSEVLRILGYSVYDCDSRAKSIMNSSEYIKKRLKDEICHEIIDENGMIDRKLLSSIVFNDRNSLNALNQIVHQSVKEDLLKWITENSKRPVFVETAILYQSGIDKIVESVWDVYAPTELRINRVMVRNSMTKDEVVARIQSQHFDIKDKHNNTIQIINDGNTALLPQIESLLRN